MSYRPDKLVIDTHTHTHRPTDAGDDNTRRPKLASGKKGLDYINISKVWSIHVICIRRFGNLSSRLHVSNSGTRTLFDWKCGVSVFHSCNIRIVWGLWSQSNFHDMIISIINIFWLHWIINCLVVMHPYALSHNKAVLNWNNFVWSIRLILIQGLIASRSNKQQPTDAVS